MEDLLLIEEVFTLDEVIHGITQLINDGQSDVRRPHFLAVLKAFPSNVQKSHENLKFAELADLFNALNQIRRASR